MTYFATDRQDVSPKTVGLLGFDGVAALDLIGPLEALANARCDDSNGRPGMPCYKPLIVSLTNKTFTSESGFTFKTDWTIKTALELDTLIIPGGTGLRQPEVNRQVARWLSIYPGEIRRIACVSTGIYALASSGLVDGCHVTTHWRFVH